MTSVQTIGPAPAVAWESELRGASYLLKSGLCPVALKTPEAVMFVVLAGRDLGLSPVASLRGLTIIQGKIEVSADLQLGMFHRAGGKSRWVELTDTAAVIELVAPWMTAPHRSAFSMADAQRAGIATGNYQKYPKAMLRSRAITQGLKDVGFDATAGCYAPGEISGVVVEPVSEQVTVAEPTPITMPASAAEPWLTGAELKELKREAVAAGIDTPEAWKALVADTVPDWTASRGLSASEAAQIRKRLIEGDAYEPVAEVAE